MREDIKYESEREWFQAQHESDDYELKFRTYFMNGRPQIDIRWYQRMRKPNGARFWQPTRKGLRVPFDMRTLLMKGLQSIPDEIENEDAEKQR